MENKINFRYITLEELSNGLQISLNEEGIELVKELKEDGKSEFDIWYELFEDVRGNSEYIFHNDMGESGFGLTNAEGITDGYFNSDNGDGYDTNYPESAKVYWFPNYMITSSLDKMYEEGKVFFTKADEKYKNGGGIYSSDDRWVVIFQNQDSAKFEKVTVGANNKKNAIAIAEDESGLGSDWQYYSAEKEMANGGSIDEETIIRNKNKNDWKSKFDFYLKYNNGNIGKGSLMDMAYDDTKGVDSAIPQSLAGDVDNTAFFVYDYKDNFAGELVDLRDKLKFSNTKVDVTVVVNGDVLRKDNLPNELLNPTFHQALDYVFKHDEVEAFNIRPTKSRYENGGGVAKELKGYRVNIYKSGNDTSSQNVVSSKFNKTILVTDGVKGDSFSVMSNEPYIKLVKRNLFGKEFLSAEPVNFGVDKNHKMFGGSFVWSSDSRFRKDISERPIPLHDRVEVYENGGVFVSPHVNNLHNYIIASYGFLLPQEGESGYDKFTYSDFAEELKSTYDIKNPRNKQVYDYLIHLGNVKMFSGNVSDMKKIEERMSTANIKFDDGGEIIKFKYTLSNATSKAKKEINFLQSKGYSIDSYSTINQDSVFGEGDDVIFATQGSKRPTKGSLEFAIAYFYEDEESGVMQIREILLDLISEEFRVFKVTLYTNAGVDLHSITEGKHKNIQVVKVAYGEFSGNSDEYAKGGTVESLEKELRKLQRDLMSHRLSTYREGDESEEEKARKKEREVKLARFNEVLDLLRDNESKLANGGTINKKKLKGDIGKITGKQYGYTLENFEKAQGSIFVSPNDYWKKQEGSDYKDFIGRKQLITDRDKDRLMESYAYKIMIAIDLGSKKVPSSAKKYAESMYELKSNEIAAKYSKGGGINSGRDLLFKSNQPHEQSYKRKREFKKYRDNGNWFSDFFENGGDISNQNALMVMNDNKQIKHHTEELNKVVDTNTTVPAWIVAKVHRSASDLSDASHYLDGVNTEFKNGGGVYYGEIKKEKEKMTSELLEKCGVFFAFSNEQFIANKTPLKEGEKYVSIGGGGYMPKGNIDAFSEGMKAISKLGKKKVKENNLAETEILYELNNHECFYTGDYSDVVDMFKGTYTEEQIRDVYNKHIESGKQFKEGGKAENSITAYLGEVISNDTAEMALGRKINSWKDEVITIDGISYRKVFLKSEYKQIK